MTVAASRASNPKDQQALAASGRPTGATLSPGDALLAPGARSMALVDDGPLLLLQPALPAATPTGLTTVLSSEMLRGESYRDALEISTEVSCTGGSGGDSTRDLVIW